MNVTKGTVHIYFAGGVKDGALESHLNPPDVMTVDVETLEGGVMYHEYVKQRVDEMPGGFRGQQGVWVYNGTKWRETKGD